MTRAFRQELMKSLQPTQECDRIMNALHKNARITPAVRVEIAASDETASALAQRLGMTEQTFYKWKKRSYFTDRTHTKVASGSTRTAQMKSAARDWWDRIANPGCGREAKAAVSSSLAIGKMVDK
jgi:hypothetical protein